MKKNLIILLLLLLWASPAAAQQAAEAQTPESLEDIQRTAQCWATATYHWTAVLVQENTSISSHRWAAHWTSNGTPLPHRFSLESYYLNQKDYFGEMNYAYRDVVLFNMYTREMYHNLDHFSFGPDDPTTPSPSFVDKNPKISMRSRTS